MLEIGAVPHADDAVANKQGGALQDWGAGPGPLDADATLASGRHFRDRLLELTATTDVGFDEQMFASALGALTPITDAALDEHLRRGHHRPAPPLRLLAPAACSPASAQSREGPGEAT